MLTHETTLPIFIGSTRAEVSRALGESTDQGLGGSYDSYPTHGLTVAYNQNDLVRSISIVVRDTPGSDEYRVFGLAIGGDKDSYAGKFGEPFKTIDYSWARFYVWQFDSCWLKVETWIEDGDEPPWGQYRLGDVSAMELSDQPFHMCIDED